MIDIVAAVALSVLTICAVVATVSFLRTSRGIMRAIEEQNRILEEPEYDEADWWKEEK